MIVDVMCKIAEILGALPGKFVPIWVPTGTKFDPAQHEVDFTEDNLDDMTKATKRKQTVLITKMFGFERETSSFLDRFSVKPVMVLKKPSVE